MLSIWIIHREPKARAAIARISGVGERAVLASPTDAVLDGADAPTVVVLGLSGDFEIELECVHRHAAKLAGCDWIVLASADDLEEARRLFDTLPGRFLVYPPEARALRRALRDAVQRRHADPLSARQGRAELQERFARWFGDLELPELMRALDPRLARVPVLIHGEPGTGRGLLARYIHASGGHAEHGFVQLSCRPDTTAEELLDAMRAAIARAGDAARGQLLTFHLEDVDQLPTPVQRRLRDWIEFGMPDGGARRHGHRFMASAASVHDLDDDPGLDPRLGETLSGLTLVLPPLRDRSHHIGSFVLDTAASLARARGERARRFGADAIARLAAHPWPGNLHELEAVVTRTLAFTRADPIEPIHLRFPSDLPWLDEPARRVDLSPHDASHAPPETASMPSGLQADEVERPTAFPDPRVAPIEPEPGVEPTLPEAVTAHPTPPLTEPAPADTSIEPEPVQTDTSIESEPLEAIFEPAPLAEGVEPIDDLGDLDPGAAPGREDDLEVGRVATLGAEPVTPESLDALLDGAFDQGADGASGGAAEAGALEPPGFVDETPHDEEDLPPADESPHDEESLFPADDLDDESESWLDDDEIVPSDGDVLSAPLGAGRSFDAELVGSGGFDDSELFAEVELIEEPETAHLPDPPQALHGSQALDPPQALDWPQALDPPRALDRPSALAPSDVDAGELLPDVEPLAPPVRPLPDAAEGDAVARTLAEEALPFDDPFERPEPRPEPEQAASQGIDPHLYELVGAIAHEVRNPLVSIRTFSELLPDHYDDPEFRSHFRELVVKDVARIDRVVSRLQALAEGQRKTEPVDVARMLDRLLDERRPVIQSRRLLVLKELDHTSPFVVADAEQIEDAISGLLDRAIAQASERGDVYLASKHDPRGPLGRPSVRILIRHTTASPGAREGTATIAPVPDPAMLDLVLAKRLIEAQGGDLSVDDADVGESVIVVELPAA